MESGRWLMAASRVAGLFPGPLVGIALLLAILIVLTPILTSNGQPAAGSIFSQAELIVDALPGNNSTHFYVRALSSTARFSEIRFSLAGGFNWTGAFPRGILNWTEWQNASEVVSISALTTDNPVAVNVTALYSANGASAYYVGLLALDFGYPPGSSGETLSVASATSGISGFSTPVTNLPLPITLVDVGPGP
jgi:hypothetical protein